MFLPKKFPSVCKFIATSTSEKRLGTSMLNMSRNLSTTRPQDSAKKFDGKVAIVTASTQGIGLAIARRLAEDGASVMISSRKAANVDQAVEEIKKSSTDAKVSGIACHVGNASDRDLLVRETLNTFGAIDFLVSNAGTNPAMGLMLECTEDQWDKIFDVNVKSSFLLAKSVVPHMRKRGGGSVVFIASIAGFQPMPMILPYSVSKTALLGLTKALSFELGQENIRVNCVCPGIIETKFASALTGNDFIAERIKENLHVKRFGKPSDISGIVSFLCSEDASYITGENVVVAGGLQSRL